jgi:DNA-binding response OmpR family regulator
MAFDGAQALHILKKAPPDLVILDLGLPKLTGESVCIEAKKQYPDLPIIILTAKNHTTEVVHGFQLGADDYVAKPFELEELLARIKSKLKNTEQELLQVADLTLNTKSLEVIRNGKNILLSPHEFKLLQYLMMNKGTVLTREMILNRIWQYAYDVDSRVVDVYIGYLRRKIDTGSKKKLINSIRGFGYVIKD